MATRMKAEKLKALNEDRIRSLMKGQRADRDYLLSHYQDLLSKYRNHWVVISGGKLIIKESNPDRLLEALSQTRRNDMFVYYLADPEDTMII
ncbi:hypothetical protein ES703_119761 [subsurface metagenome]